MCRKWLIVAVAVIGTSGWLTAADVPTGKSGDPSIATTLGIAIMIAAVVLALIVATLRFYERVGEITCYKLLALSLIVCAALFIFSVAFSNELTGPIWTLLGSIVGAVFARESSGSPPPASRQA